MKNKTFLYLATILIFSFFGMFGKLSVAELQPLGSAAHAAISREILRTGDWLTLHWPYCEEFKDFYQFPPLFFWLQAITFKIFGISDTTAKYVSSFFGVLVILLTFFLAKIISDDDYIAFLSSLTLILHPYFFRHARKCELETGLIFFVTLAILFFVISEKKQKPWLLILSGISSGLGFLYKGPPAYCVLGVVFLYYVLTKQYKKLLNSYFILFILTAITIPLSWIILQLVYKGNDVIEKFFINQILWSIKGRGVKYTSLLEKIKNYLFFFPAFFSYYLPWSITGIFGIIKVIKEKSKLFYILLLWIIIVWIGFTIPGYKDDYYLLAFWPGWAVFNGYIFSLWTYRIKDNLIKIFAVLSLIFALVTFFTPIKFDKIRNPEFKILGKYIQKIVPETEEVFIYNMYYWDMAGLFAWYVERKPAYSLKSPEEIKEKVVTNKKIFLLIYKKDLDELPEEIKEKIYPIYYCGRFVLATNKKD